MRGEEAWLAGLKAGDLVVIVQRYGDSRSRVARLTATQVVLQNGLRFRRADGGRIGASAWDHSWCVEPTQDRLDEIERRKSCDELRAMQWSKLPLDVLRSVMKEIAPHLEPK